MFQNTVNLNRFLFIHNIDPNQNSKTAKIEISKPLRGKQISIIARSSCVSSIENVFNLVEPNLGKDAITKNICYETFEQFSNPVQATMMDYPSAEIEHLEIYG